MGAISGVGETASQARATHQTLGRNNKKKKRGKILKTNNKNKK